MGVDGSEAELGRESEAELGRESEVGFEIEWEDLEADTLLFGNCLFRDR